MAYIPLTDAAPKLGYSVSHVRRLCVGGLISARRDRAGWTVDIRGRRTLAYLESGPKPGPKGKAR